MRDPGLDRVDHELARLVDRTDRVLAPPDVAHIHRRAESRTIRGIAATFAVTTVVGVGLAGLVVGVGGVGMHDGQPMGRAGSAASTGGRGPAVTAPPPGAGPQGTVAAPTSRHRPTPSPSVPTTNAVPGQQPGPTGTTVPRPAQSPHSRPPTRAPSSVRSAVPSPVAPTPPPVAPSPRTEMSATTVARPPLVLRVDFKSGQLDSQGCRTTSRVSRTVPAPTPRSVVRTVLDGPSGVERGRGLHSVFGRSGQPTPATVAADWNERMVTVDFASISPMGVSPTHCRGREIRGPIVDALRQYDPRWSVRLTVAGSADRFTDYLNGA